MTDKKKSVLFVVLAYALFWLMLIAGGAVLLSGNEELFLEILPYVQIISTWAPTFALLILFKKLYPGWTVKEFYKSAFRERLNLKILLGATIAYSFINFGIVGVEAFTKEVSFLSLLDFSFFGFAVTFFSGATGEESGWRGYLQPSMEKKHSVIKASFLVGIIWAFWHTLTWFISGFSGMDLVWYILLEILSKISCAIIIGICYSRCRNLLVPMWIHFVSNILINWTQGVLIDHYIWYVLLEAIVAIGYMLWYRIISKNEIAAV